MSLTFQPLPFGHRLGLFILAEISAVSAISVIILLGYIAYSTLNIRASATRRWKLESAVHLFLLNQLVCDLIQALGGLMNLKWVVDGNVHQGSFCQTQGLIKQLADVGTAFSAGSVAILTFSTIIFRLKLDRNLLRAVLIVVGIWIAIILNVAINVGVNGASRFYGPAGPWCWISGEFSVQRTVADFLWMWISAFSSVLAYVPVFLVLGGFIETEGWRVRWTYGRQPPHSLANLFSSRRVAYKMLAYPVIYIITVLPLSAARYNELDKPKSNTPIGVVVLADGLYLLSGLLNVMLYAYIRPDLLPHDPDPDDHQSFSLHSEPRPDSVIDFNVAGPSPKSGDPLYTVPEMANRHEENSLIRGQSPPANDVLNVI